MSNDRLFADEAKLPRVEAICGAAIDLINAKLSPLKSVSVSTILIDPGKASQFHYHRVMEEVYYFISGNGRVTVGDKSFAVAPGTAVGIPVGHWHQVFNTGAGELKFISADSPSFDPTDTYFQ
jgi:mannose-6-phosphate isomerase-like protein (cupin superfamily)